MQNLTVSSNYCVKLRNIYRNLGINYRMQSPQAHLLLLIRVTLQTTLKMRATSHRLLSFLVYRFLIPSCLIFTQVRFPLCSIIWKVMKSTINWHTGTYELDKRHLPLLMGSTSMCLVLDSPLVL